MRAMTTPSPDTPATDRRALLAALLALGLAPAAPEAGAQMRPGGPGGGGPSGGPGVGVIPGSRPEIGAPRAFDVTLHELEEDLKLTRAQQPLWTRYEDAVRALADDVRRERTPVREEPVDFAQRVDRVVAAYQNRLTAVEEIALAAKALYATLTPEQRRVADPRLATVMAMPLAGGVRESGPLSPGNMPPRGQPPSR
jgi:hypothetical protein